MKGGGHLKRLVKLVLLILIAYVAYTGYSIWTYESDDLPNRADAAIVLGAAAWHDDPSPVLKERLKHAIQLYKDNLVSNLIFTGGRGDGAKYAESEVAETYALEQGVPKEDIFIETASKITEENLDYAKEIGEKQGFSSYIIVSDSLHLKRAMLMAEQDGIQAYASPTETSAYQSFDTRFPFFLREWAFYLGYQLDQYVEIPDSFIQKVKEL